MELLQKYISMGSVSIDTTSSAMNYYNLIKITAKKQSINTLRPQVKIILFLCNCM